MSVVSLSGVKPPYEPLLMADVLAAEGKNGFKVASTFSGAGGSCMGYRLAGYTLVWANEFEPNALATYRLNCQAGCISSERDIRTVRGANILEATDLQIGELDLFDGSPPCQSFSTMGKREKGWGKHIEHGDGTSQRSDDLFEEYIRLVRELQPKTFIAENVTGLVKGTAKGYFKMVLAWMKEAGYNVEAAIIDSRWLGVPQARQRVIFIGVRQDVYDAVTKEKARLERFPQPAPWFYSVADACPWIRLHGKAIDTNEWAKRGRDYSTTMIDSNAHPTCTITASMQSTGGGACIVKAEHPKCDDPGDQELVFLTGSAKIAWDETQIGKNHPKNFSCAKVDETHASPTIASMQGTGGMHGIAHPYEPRRFSILEVKRLCSFPDDFKMIGNFQQRWARLGNAVPPLMMKAIAAAVRDSVLIPHREATK